MYNEEEVNYILDLFKTAGFEDESAGLTGFPIRFLLPSNDPNTLPTDVIFVGKLISTFYIYWYLAITSSRRKQVTFEEFFNKHPHDIFIFNLDLFTR